MRSETTPHPPLATRAERAARHAKPNVSVVVVTKHSRPSTDSFLSTILSRCVQATADVIVVHCGPVRRTSVLATHFPSVRFVGGAPDAGFESLRKIGMRHAVGDIVYFLEDRETLDESASEDVLVRASRYAG